MKILNKQKIISVLLFCCLYFLQAGFVNAEGLVVEFEKNPLFSETNFVPNESVVRYVKVTNNSTEKGIVIVEAINPNSCDEDICLSDALNLVIKKNSEELFNDSLSNFFNSGEVVLDTLLDGEIGQYDFIVTFKPDSGNEYQILSTGFDLLVGFQGTGEFVVTGEDDKNVILGGGGGGSNGPPGLVIKDESSVVADIFTVDITWRTSFPATSQVIYRKEGESYGLDLSDPKYGYPRIAPLEEDTNMVLDHLVTIKDLTPGDIYYYRVVSHASPATVSFEHSFKMPTVEDLVKSALETDSLSVAEDSEGNQTLVLKRDEENGGDLLIGNLDNLKEEFDLSGLSNSSDLELATSSSQEATTTESNLTDTKNTASVIFGIPWLKEISFWWLIILLLLFFTGWYIFKKK